MFIMSKKSTADIPCFVYVFEAGNLTRLSISSIASRVVFAWQAFLKTFIPPHKIIRICLNWENQRIKVQDVM